MVRMRMKMMTVHVILVMRMMMVMNWSKIGMSFDLQLESITKMIIIITMNTGPFKISVVAETPAVRSFTVVDHQAL